MVAWVGFLGSGWLCSPAHCVSCPKRGKLAKLESCPSCRFSPSIFPPELRNTSPSPTLRLGVYFLIFDAKMSLYVVLCHSGPRYTSTYCMLSIVPYPHYWLNSPTPASPPLLPFVALDSFDSMFMPYNILLIYIKIQVQGRNHTILSF